MKDNKNFLNKVESFLLKTSIIGILLLVGLQIVINHNDLSLFLDETIFSNNSTVKGSHYNQKGIIELEIEDIKYNQVEILINGEKVQKFDNKVVRINVYNNDLIEINGTMYNNNVKVKIVGVSSNLNLPKLNTVIHTFKNIKILDKVVLK